MHEKLALFILLSPLLVMVTLPSNYVDVTVFEAKTMIDYNPSLVILDVRNQSEYDSGHIRNAKLIPFSELEARLGELKKSDEILVYCRTGERSSAASKILVDNGFLHVYNMIGGITEWINAGHPIYVKYSLIQEAIDNAGAEETIFVSAGVYFERLVINKSLTLTGENKATTIIDGKDAGTVIRVKTDNVSINGFTLRESGCACLGYSGVYVENYHQNISVFNNLMIHNGYGIKVDLSSNIIISGNTIIDNSLGIQIVNSTNTSILRNNITKNNIGIYIYYFSKYNSIVGNNLVENDYGIWFDRSSNNSIYHNNFVNNTRQVHIENSVNVWDDDCPSGGNYWSNYTGADEKSGFNQDQLGSDGIGDTHYLIDSNNRDRYPLMGMFSDFNVTSESYVQTICNSTISNFQFNGTAISFSITGETGTSGFCRICIPIVLMNGTYEVFVNGTKVSYVLLPSPYSTSTHNCLYFTFSHSTQGVIIVPEFPSLLLLPLFMITSLLAVLLVCRRSKEKQDYFFPSYRETPSQ